MSDLWSNQQNKVLISDRMSHPEMASQLEEAALQINRLETLVDKLEVKLHKSEKTAWPSEERKSGAVRKVHWIKWKS